MEILCTILLRNPNYAFDTASTFLDSGLQLEPFAPAAFMHSCRIRKSPTALSDETSYL
jgi:hypothetical protein